MGLHDRLSNNMRHTYKHHATYIVITITYTDLKIKNDSHTKRAKSVYTFLKPIKL